MKLILALITSLITLSSALTSFAADIFKNTNPQYFTNCRLEFSSNYYYVSRNGQKFTDYTSNLNQAIEQQRNLERTGVCQYSSQSPGSCQLEYSSNYYYVSRNGSRMSEFVSDYRSALSTRDLLYQSNNCDTGTYRPYQVCTLEFSSNYYYVTRNGSRFSDYFSNLNEAAFTRDDFARNYVCQIKYEQQNCRLEYSSNYYYISTGSKRISDYYSRLNQAIDQQRAFSDRGMCAPAIPERCSIEYSSNYYYVARNGSRISDFESNFAQADSTLRELQYSRNCY